MFCFVFLLWLVLSDPLINSKTILNKYICAETSKVNKGVQSSQMLKETIYCSLSKTYYIDCNTKTW